MGLPPKLLNFSPWSMSELCASRLRITQSITGQIECASIDRDDDLCRPLSRRSSFLTKRIGAENLVPSVAHVDTFHLPLEVSRTSCTVHDHSSNERATSRAVGCAPHRGANRLTVDDNESARKEIRPHCVLTSSPQVNSPTEYPPALSADTAWCRGKPRSAEKKLRFGSPDVVPTNESEMRK